MTTTVLPNCGPPTPALPWGRRDWLMAGALAMAVLIPYGLALPREFVTYDDNIYVTDNPYLELGLSREGLLWGLTTVRFAIWHPLVWWSLLLDYQLYGFEAWGYHQTNVLLHLASALVLFAALRRLSGEAWPSFLAAALFAVHPLNVQSVAWVSERKGLLSGLFWMLTLWAYAGYAARPALGRYLLVCASLALALMSKQTALTLTLVLLLLDYWPLERWHSAGPRRVLLEKLPLLALSALASAFILYVQRTSGGHTSLELIPLSARCKNALVSYVAYLGQAFVPVGLAPYYPHPGPTLATASALAAGLLLAALTIVVLRARRAPYLAVGWLWFVGTLLPVSGLVQLGNYARADRYVYVPLVGIFIALAWSAAALAQRWRGERPVAVVLGAVVLCLGTWTWVQVHYWHNSVLLWEHALQVTGSNYLAHLNLAAAWRHADPLEARRHAQQALQHDPASPDAHTSLGLILMDLADWPQARVHFLESVRLDPDSYLAHANLGIMLRQQHELTEAVKHLEAALRFDPAPTRVRTELAEALDELAAGHAAKGEYAAARACAAQALEHARALPRDDLVQRIERKLRDYAK